MVFFIGAKNPFFVPTIENGDELCIRVCFSFFFFFFLYFTQNQVPQIIIDWVEGYTIRKPFQSRFEPQKKSQKLFLVLRKTTLKILLFCLIPIE